MIDRDFWIKRIKDAWTKRPVVWLSGVRRAGKTTLAQMLPEAVYMNCDLPSVSRALAEPEAFLDSLPDGSTVVFDEVHRLDDPSRLLKIAADVYLGIRILATGSSTLAATHKFRDSLTGRKSTIYLSPVLWEECLGSFNMPDLDRRMLRGGLPEPLLSKEKDPDFFSEWMDSFYARDIQELFNIRDRSAFLALFHLLMRQSGGLLEYTGMSKQSGVSRPTVKSYVEAMRIAHACYLLPPFHGGGKREIVRAPRCYAFDTGFVTFVRGWNVIREEDRGILWEHMVLDSLRARLPDNAIHYWRDKSGREIDFVIKTLGRGFDAVECKIDPERFDPGNLRVFRKAYPEGENHVLSPVAKTPYDRSFGDIRVRFSDNLFGG